MIGFLRGRIIARQPPTLTLDVALHCGHSRRPLAPVQPQTPAPRP